MTDKLELRKRQSFDYTVFFMPLAMLVGVSGQLLSSGLHTEEHHREPKRALSRKDKPTASAMGTALRKPEVKPQRSSMGTTFWP